MNSKRKLKIEKSLKRLVKHLKLDNTPVEVGSPNVFIEKHKNSTVDVTLSFMYKPNKKSKK